jgi:hypothetical protein
MRLLLRPLFLSLSLLAVALAHADDTVVMHCQPGPWGRIDYSFINLEAPDNILDDYPLPSPLTRWSFSDRNQDWLKIFLANLGYDTATVNRLVNDPRSQMDEENIITVYPTEADVLALTAPSRQNLAHELAKYTENPYYHDPICVPDGNVTEWLHGLDLPPNVIDLIRKLTYQDGEGYFFSDLRLVLKYATSDAEARRWVKGLMRVRAVMANLHVDPSGDLAGLQRYWSANFHRTDSLPMLNAAAETPGGAQLDLTHLLPPLPRRLAYSYTSPDIERSGQTPNCHWTSLNFFNYTRQNILLDLKLATSQVLENYITVSPPYAFGDVLFFLNEDGNAFHSCVYLADNLVFTKNGENEIMPWIVTRLEDVKQTYGREPNYKIQVYRRKWPEGG